MQAEDNHSYSPEKREQAATHGPFALLDDAGADGARSRLLTGFVREHRCEDPASLDAILAAAQQDMGQGFHALILADYEWGVRLMGAGHPSTPGALRILMFRHCRFLDGSAVDTWLVGELARGQPQDSNEPAAGFFGWAPSVARDEFTRAVERIQELIAAGETYQINYSYRIEGWAHGDSLALYRSLRQRQPVPFGALIRLPAGDENEYVLSLSPELFLSLQGDRLTARPMKGTARVPDRDVQQAASALSQDAKNRAENVMIVDLLRNDLSRVARLGSVKVPALFEVEAHGSVLQMTSRVEAQLRDGATLADVLRASFPCGSITGAPKRRSVELISEIESTPRGLYTGAIGWWEPASQGASCGAFCMSVAIRTLTLGPKVDGLRKVRFGVGAGIVADSDPAAEYAECELKSAFLTHSPAGFGLIETMYARERQIPLLQRHLARLRASASELGFALDEPALRVQIDAALSRCDGECMVRLCLQSDGRFELTSKPLVPIDPKHRRLLLAPHPAHRPPRLSRHKTTLRHEYDRGVRDAIAADAFDTLYYTQDGRLVEGARSNVLVCLDGRWYTPPVSDGALPGVLRSVLLSSAEGEITEKSITLDDLQRASAVIACNALRGIVPIHSVGDLEFDAAAPALGVAGLLRTGFMRTSMFAAPQTK